MSTLATRTVRAVGQPGRSRGAEKGQVLILWVLAATVILVIGAIVVDVGLWLTERRRAQMAADFAALAAATELANGPGAAEAKALDFARRNGFANGGDVEVQVNPNYGPNEVEVTIKQGSPLLFAGIFGVGGFDIGARAVGTIGSGEAGELDLAIIIDRTTTMSGAPLANAKAAALAALQIFDDNLQHVALGVIAATNPGLGGWDSGCGFSGPGLWVAVPLSDNYRNPNGSLNMSSELVNGINCLGISSGPGTNFGDSIEAGANELLSGSAQSPTAKKAIIFLTDGQANQPGNRPCEYGYQKATAAQNAGVEIFTIGFGVSGMTCPDSGGPYNNGALVTRLLAAMATASDDQFGHCVNQADMDAENADRDHFFCEAKDEDLAPIFERVAEDLSHGYRLKE